MSQETLRIDPLTPAIGAELHGVDLSLPVTERPYLYVNRGFTIHVIGMSTRESDRLLQYLFDHIDRPEFQVRYRWRRDSVAMWDNRDTQHYAVADYTPHYRRMQRVTVADDRRADPRKHPSSVRHVQG